MCQCLFCVIMRYRTSCSKPSSSSSASSASFDSSASTGMISNRAGTRKRTATTVYTDAPGGLALQSPSKSKKRAAPTQDDAADDSETTASDEQDGDEGDEVVSAARVKGCYELAETDVFAVMACKSEWEELAGLKEDCGDAALIVFDADFAKANVRTPNLKNVSRLLKAVAGEDSTVVVCSLLQHFAYLSKELATTG